MSVGDFKIGDMIIYSNPGASKKRKEDVLGEVVALFEKKVRVKLTNKRGVVALKDVRPECIRKL